MSFIAVHRDERLVLATDDPVLAPDQVRSFADAQALAAALRVLRDGEAARVEAALTRAHAQGLAEGRAQGWAQAREEAAEALADTVEPLLADARRQEAELRASVLKLSLLVVRCIASTLAHDELLAALAGDALDRVLGVEGRAAPCVLRLHPQWIDAVRGRVQARRPDLHVEWRGDDSLTALDCVIETAAGRVLAGLDEQLEHIRAVLETLPAAPSADSAAAALAFAGSEA